MAQEEHEIGLQNHHWNGEGGHKSGRYLLPTVWERVIKVYIQTVGLNNKVCNV